MLAEVEQLLNRSMGLDAASLGASAIERAVRERQQACSVPGFEAYLALLRSSERELQELIEAVVVPETWFFRDRGAYAALTRIATTQWPKAPALARRLLSLPCATGEEPYSMAMCLLDAGLAASRFSIDAIDISERALARARRAHYTSNSFRGEDLTFRDRHFERSGRGHQLHATVRERVSLQHGNFFDDALLPGNAVYDVVFCRNVLIYFDRAAQDHAVRVLARLLKPDGQLFVGPSETALLTSHGFVSTRVPMAFAFRPPASAGAPPAVARAKKISTPPPPARLRPPAQMFPVRAKAAPATPASAAPPAPGLDAIAELADRGELRQAAAACEIYLHDHADSAPAHYLMGLVRDAGGEMAAATTHYRKALYLDATHQDAMAHLALLLERAGDAGAAQALRNRARRLQMKPPP